MGKTLILIHGRDFKPPKAKLQALWKDSIRWGIERDHPNKVQAFDRATVEFVYYGDVSNAYLCKVRKLKEPPDDSEDRRESLNRLKNYKRNQFTKAMYQGLPGASPIKEAFADLLAGPLAALMISDLAIHKVAPDMREYWDEETAFGSDVRFPMIGPLCEAMDRNDSICIVAHSLGTLITYDTLWKFSHLGEYRGRYDEKKVDLLITLGSPLADETVKRRLKGSKISGARRYPRNIIRWLNVAAEDDFISHDGEVSNDYAEMKQLKLLKSIADKRIYNLSVRHGSSNPHHDSGYLLHPVVADAIADWL